MVITHHQRIRALLDGKQPDDPTADFWGRVASFDNLAGQNGLLVSTQIYREFIKPRHTVLNCAIHSKTQANILSHGGLDVEILLLEGSPADIKAHVSRYLEALKEIV